MKRISIGAMDNLYFEYVEEVKKRVLSRDCDGCSKLKECSKRYQKAVKGDKVYCPDGTAHLIDSYSINSNPEVVCFFEAFQ